MAESSRKLWTFPKEKNIKNGTLNVYHYIIYVYRKVGKSLYSELELTKGASDAEINRQYRKLALRFHPDKNPDAGGATVEKVNQHLSRTPLEFFSITAPFVRLQKL